MSRLKLTTVLGLLLTCLFYVSPASAQATRTWVSGVGDDANPCSRTAPCKTFAGAISKTAARGEISVLDPGGYGAVTITKSISIVNDVSGEAGILAAGTNGVIVNAAATDVVILRGIVIDGGTAAVPGLNGIRFLAGAALHVENCLIKNFSGVSPNGHGIMFAPSGVAELYVSNTTVASNGNAAAATGAGIFIQPTGTGSANVSISNVRVENNNRGILADSTTSSATTSRISISDSYVAGNTGLGIGVTTAPAGGALMSTMVSRSTIVGNQNGLVANGSAATIRIGSSTISGGGVGALSVNGGSLLSYKNNQINDNITDGTPIAAVALN